MDKGIFILVCTLLTIGVVALCTLSLSGQIKALPKQVVFVAQPTVVTPTLIATPSAAVIMKRVISPVK